MPLNQQPKRYHQRVCEGGHQITAYIESTSDNSKFCEKCGASVIEQCPNCGALIPGAYPGVIKPLGSIPVPNYCNQCGKAYPWASKKIEKIKNAVQNSQELKKKDKTQIENALEQLNRGELTDEKQITIFTKFKRLAPKAWSIVQPIFSDILASVIKKQIGL